MVFPTFFVVVVVVVVAFTAISYPEYSGSLTSGWSPGETLGNWNFITAGFLR